MSDVARFRHLAVEWFTPSREMWYEHDRDVFDPKTSNEIILKTEESLMQIREGDVLPAIGFDCVDAFAEISKRIGRSNIKFRFSDFPRVIQLRHRLRYMRHSGFVSIRLKLTEQIEPRLCSLCWGKCLTWCYERPNEPLHAMHAVCRAFVEVHLLGECVCAAVQGGRPLCGWMMGDLTEADELLTQRRETRQKLSMPFD